MMLTSLKNSFLSLMEVYLRVSFDGTISLPKKKGALIIANHGSCVGLDALMLCHVIERITGRRVFVMAHSAWFKHPKLKSFAKSLNMIDAKYSEALTLLQHNDVLLIFPEAEDGNYKPLDKKYQLQGFKNGFVRLAISAQVPIFPITILGAEESHPNLGRISILKKIFNYDLPLPLNLWPLPAKWKIHFGKKIPAPHKKISANEIILLKSEIRSRLQTQLNAMIEKRKFIYLPDETEKVVLTWQERFLAVEFANLFNNKDVK